jgi:hypothetical protein
VLKPPADRLSLQEAPRLYFAVPSFINGHQTPSKSPASNSASEGGFSSRASLLRPATLQLKLAFVIERIHDQPQLCRI